MKAVKGKTVLITGSAMGMGKLLAKRFAQDEARLVLTDIQSEVLEQTAEEIRSLGAYVFAYVCDVADWNQVCELRDQVHREVGKVDVIVNNAGVVWGGDFLEVPPEKLRKTIEVNVNGVMWISKAFLSDLYERGEGHVINMASAAGLMGVANLSAYSASKFAVVGLTEALRQEAKRRKLWKVKFTIVCPSFVSTGMFAGVKPPRFSPWLPPEEMVDKIYRGFKKDKPIIMEPFMVKFIPFVKAVTTVSRFDKIAHYLKVNKAMDTWRGREGGD